MNEVGTAEVIGPLERVVVIGAGISGLAAAAALTKAGVECVVLEARDRIGGRLHTIDLAGVPADLGGSWIHHPLGNPLTEFADAAGLLRDEGDPMPTISVYDQAEGRLLSRVEQDGLIDIQFEQFPDAIEHLRGQLGPTATAADAIEAFAADAELEADVARRARQMLRAEIEADAADRAENQSLQWVWNEIEYGGDLFGDLPRDGYKSVVDALAVGVAVQLGVEVTRVELAESGVRVHCADDSVVQGSHCVVTVPLGVLKRGVPEFSPALPDDRQHAIEQLGFGRYEKVVLRFEQPFWADAGRSHLIILPREADAPAVWVFDLHAFGAGPALAAHVFHSNTPLVLEQTTDEAVRWALDLISEAVGVDCPEPVASAVTSWTTDRHTGGAYTHVPPNGADPSMLDLFGEPVEGRLLFAGEHTQSARTGYADGAFSSGLKAADALLAVRD